MQHQMIFSFGFSYPYLVAINLNSHHVFVLFIDPCTFLRVFTSLHIEIILVQVSISKCVDVTTHKCLLYFSDWFAAGGPLVASFG